MCLFAHPAIVALQRLLFGALACCIVGSCSSAAELTNYSSSWVGNTFGGGYTAGKWVQYRIRDIAVHPDGRVLAMSDYDEARRSASLYKDGAIWNNGWTAVNGTLVGGFGSNQSDQPEGATCCFHPTQAFMYAPLNNDRTIVRRWNLGGSITSLAFNIGFEPSGLASTASLLAVAGSNSIRLYNIEDGVFVRAWTVNGAGQMAFESDGDIWAISGSFVREYSQTGTQKRQLSLSGWQPKDVAIDNQGRLMVADDGPSHQVRFFSIAGAGAPSQVDVLGIAGGINAGTPGAVTGSKFWGLVGCGCDSLGNYYVAMNEEGCVLRAFNSQKQLLWDIKALHFLDNVVADPRSTVSLYGTQDWCIDFQWPVDITRRRNIFSSRSSAALLQLPQIVCLRDGFNGT